MVSLKDFDKWFMVSDIKIEELVDLTQDMFL